MNICSKPGCQTTAGCICDRVAPEVKFYNKRTPLSEYTDEEITQEYYFRAQKKLGDPRIGVGVAGLRDTTPYFEGVDNAMGKLSNSLEDLHKVLYATDDEIKEMIKQRKSKK